MGAQPRGDVGLRLREEEKRGGRGGFYGACPMDMWSLRPEGEELRVGFSVWRDMGYPGYGSYVPKPNRSVSGE